jgi:hypothetical protein
MSSDSKYPHDEYPQGDTPEIEVRSIAGSSHRPGPFRRVVRAVATVAAGIVALLGAVAGVAVVDATVGAKVRQVGDGLKTSADRARELADRRLDLGDGYAIEMGPNSLQPVVNFGGASNGTAQLVFRRLDESTELRLGALVEPAVFIDPSRFDPAITKTKSLVYVSWTGDGNVKGGADVDSSKVAVVWSETVRGKQSYVGGVVVNVAPAQLQPGATTSRGQARITDTALVKLPQLSID